MCYNKQVESPQIKDDEVREKITAMCSELNKRLLAKFDAGRMEHNDDLMTLNIAREISEELQDVFIYGIISMLQETKNGV